MDTARSWMLRINEPGFDSWDMFTGWLEADPEHLRAYELALEEDDWAAEAVRTVGRTGRMAHEGPPEWQADDFETVAGNRHVLMRRRSVWGGALAAVLVGALAWTMLLGGPKLTEIATQPGEHRSVMLADGSRIEVNGNSLVTYDPDQPRQVTLAHGEALFEVDHDASNPFVVTVGKTRLIDAGTIFNVTHDQDRLEVAVAEGIVIYDDGSQTVQLDPGDRLTREKPGSAVVVGRTDTDTIGTWRNGLLHYVDAPIQLIARDLSRAVGKPIRVSSAAKDIRYTGTLAIGGTQGQLLASVGALLGVTITETTDSWEIEPGDGPRV